MIDRLDPLQMRKAGLVRGLGLYTVARRKGDIYHPRLKCCHPVVQRAC